ncbi:uncharacterized protein [Rutidosis leptorrhynchoides]|uniref:uncharacterized protein n=1 Tax=Rutidosis leptorrhynchoides TaxID=125765 RepID=UPI003A98EEF6
MGALFSVPFSLFYHNPTFRPFVSEQGDGVTLPAWQTRKAETEVSRRHLQAFRRRQSRRDGVGAGCHLHVAVCVDGEASSSRVPRSRIYIARDREDAAIRLYNDYFAESPVFPDKYFNRRFRMSRELFLRIVEGISIFNSAVIPDYFIYFLERPDATGRQSLTILQKCTSAIRQMEYGTTPDLFDEYIKIGEKTVALCLENFCQCVFHLFARQYLRKPTAEDIARLYNFHAQKHGLPGMLGSIDCSNNDINVLNFSPLFNTIKDGTASPSPFEVNGRRYKRGYYLGDGIYP